MRVLLLVLVVLTWTPAVASAQANLCDPRWLETASGADVRALLRGGADVNRVCNSIRNQPLHQALLTGGVSPGVIRALVEAGADILAENLFGSSPLDYAEDRFARAERNFQPGSGRYRREETIYLAVNRGFEAGSAAADAHSQLCDLDWWRSSASGPAVEALLRTPGVDPNTVCNLSNDRPIHLPLKFTSFVFLTSEIHRGIRALVDGGADLRVRNNSNRSAVDLVEIRYDRMKDRMIGHTERWCRAEITNQQINDAVVRNGPDTGTYLYVLSAATRQPYDQLGERFFMDLYQVKLGELTSKEVLCPYRGINNYR